MGRRRAVVGVVCALALAACGDGGTSLLLEIEGPSEITHIDATVTLATGRNATRAIDLAAGALPARLVVELPDVAQTVTVELAGTTASGLLHASAVVTARPNQQLRVPLTFAAGGGDGGEDGGGDRSDGGVRGPPVPRLIRNAFFDNYGGTVYSSGLGMAQNKFEISTTGIVNGDLVLFIASIDNGSNNLWPNPIAPGFTQLVQQFYGNDGQTFVVAWKFADNEPATYSGNYGPGLGSGSSTLSLIAVTGVDRATPINTWLSTFDPGPGMSPVVGSSIGLTTTVPNTTIIYASGVDWLGHDGTNTFMPPTGYSPLAQIGDRGGPQWAWTSQQIAYVTHATPGATGTISGSMNGSFTGTAWTVVIALAPTP